jgi:GT2 family glycosyltransferase
VCIVTSDFVRTSGVKNGVNMMRRSIALVTTCLNESHSVAGWRSDIEGQTRRPDEIIIVDGGSRDATLDCLLDWSSRDARVHVISATGANVARGRNLAIGAAQSALIASTDMGCRIDARWFQRLTAPFEQRPEVQAVYGAYDVNRDTMKNIVARADHCSQGGFRGTPQRGFLPSSRSIAYQKTVWEMLGGYPEDLTLAADDTVFALQLARADVTVAYAPEALVYWSRHARIRSIWREAYIYARGNGEAGLEHTRPRLYHDGQGFLAGAIADSLIQVAAVLLRKSSRALFSDGPAVAALIPLLRFGSVMQAHAGFRDGDRFGREHCLNCRQRLALAELQCA